MAKKNIPGERMFLVTLTPHVSGVVTAIQFDLKTGAAKLITENGEPLPFTTSYASLFSVDANTLAVKKCLSSLPLNKTNYLPIDIATAASHEFDMVFAVDATPDPACDDRCAIVLIQLTFEHDISGYNTTLGIRVFDVKGIKYNSEKIGWWVAIQEAFRNEKYHLGKKIGLITDHDLGKHSEFNTHNIEIFPGFKLPLGVTLCYGKDKSRENSMFQRAIIYADKLGHDYFEHVASFEAVPYEAAPVGAPYEKIIQAIPDDIENILSLKT